MNHAKKIKALFIVKILLVYTIYFSVSLGSLTPVVDAQSSNTVCCEKTLGGESCVLTEDSSQCDGNYASAEVTSCDSLAACRPVCCIGSDDGVCNRNTPQSSCTAYNGIVAGNPDCQGVSECQVGCCKFSQNPSVTSRSECSDIISEFPELLIDEIFDPVITDPAACSLQGRLQDTGCCVTSGACTYTTAEECFQITNDPNAFHDEFCSDVNQCSCTPQFTKGCLPNEDDVFWFDSCGNPEEIAEQCDYASGTSCGQSEDGEYICKNLNCEVTSQDPRNPGDTGGFRANGEAWCVYDGKVGPGLDLVGSRHFLQKCINGEEVSEPCRDFREEICVQSIENTGTNQKSSAVCRINNYEECLTTCNTAGKKVTGQSLATAMKNDFECCQQNQDSCFWRGNEKSGVCIPIVPPGFASYAGLEHSTPISRQGDGADICALGDTECTVIWVKKPLKDWKCEVNCDCLTDEWAYNANRYCNNLGDCGAYYNVAGDYTYSGYSCAVDNSLSCTGSFHGDDFSQDNFDGEVIPFEGLSDAEGGLRVVVDEGGAPSTPGTFGKFADPLYSLTVFGVGAAGAVVAGILVSAGVTTFGFGALATVGPSLAGLSFCPPCLLVAIVVMVVIMTILGSAKVDEHIFSVSCLPWQPPLQGDCNYCNNQGSQGCSEYVCRSLGRNCRFVNEGTTNELCITRDPNDVSPPFITADPLGITSGYSLTETNTGYHINEVVPPFSSITLSIKTNEIAKCKIGDIFNAPYDEKFGLIGDGGYGETHSITYRALPGGQAYNYFVRCEDYYGNQNIQDYEVSFDIDPEPDRTSPIIEDAVPPKGSQVSAGTTSTQVIFTINEPAQCRMSKTEGIVYQLMETELDCASTENPITNLNICGVEVSGLSSLEPSVFYVRCQDTNGNTNSEDYIYTLGGSSPLQITSISPEGEIFTDKFTLQVQTSEIAHCKFNGNDFLDTDSTTHIQPDLSPPLGARTYNIECVDEADNIATGSTTIEMTRDLEGPLPIRLYKEGNSLIIKTDEPSQCQYSDRRFVFGSGTDIGSTSSLTHSLSISQEIYYVSCKDNFDNVVTFIVHP